MRGLLPRFTLKGTLVGCLRGSRKLGRGPWLSPHCPERGHVGTLSCGVPRCPGDILLLGGGHLLVCKGATPQNLTPVFSFFPPKSLSSFTVSVGECGGSSSSAPPSPGLESSGGRASVPLETPPPRMSLDNNCMERALFTPRPGASFRTDRIHKHPREPALVPAASGFLERVSCSLCPSVTHLFRPCFTKMCPCCLVSGLIPRHAHSPLVHSVPGAGRGSACGFAGVSSAGHCNGEQPSCGRAFLVAHVQQSVSLSARTQVRGWYPSRSNATWLPKSAASRDTRHRAWSPRPRHALRHGIFVIRVAVGNSPVSLSLESSWGMCLPWSRMCRAVRSSASLPRWA